MDGKYDGLIRFIRFTEKDLKRENLHQGLCGFHLRRSRAEHGGCATTSCMETPFACI